MLMIEENNSKESIDYQKKILSALKFVAEIIISKNWKEIKDRADRCCPYFCPVLKFNTHISPLFKQNL